MMVNTISAWQVPCGRQAGCTPPSSIYQAQEIPWSRMGYKQVKKRNVSVWMDAWQVASRDWVLITKQFLSLTAARCSLMAWVKWTWMYRMVTMLTDRFGRGGEGENRDRGKYLFGPKQEKQGYKEISSVPITQTINGLGKKLDFSPCVKKKSYTGCTSPLPTSWWDRLQHPCNPKRD